MIMRSVIEIGLPLAGLLAPPLVIGILIRIGEKTARDRGIFLPSLFNRISSLLLQAILLLVLYFALRIYLVPGIIPGNTLALLFTILGGQYLWFVPGRHILQLQDDALRSRTDSEESQSSSHSVRIASLKPRHVRDFISERLIPLPWIITGFMLMLFLWRALSPGLTVAQRFGPVGFILLGMGELALYALWLRKEVSAPQRLGPLDDEEIISSWFNLRAFRVRSVFIMHTVLPAFFILVATVALESFRGTITMMIAVIIGAGGGAFLGLCGGIIGVLADTKQRRHDVICHLKRGKDG